MGNKPTYKELEEKVRKLKKTSGDLKIAEEALSKSKQKLESTTEHLSLLLENLPVIVYTCKAEGDFASTYISDSVTTVTGYKPEDFNSKPSFWADHIHPTDKPRIFKNIKKLFEHGHHQHEYRWKTADGSYIWFWDALRLVKLPDGTNSHIVGSRYDISERKEAEEALRLSEERSREITEKAAIGIAVLDLEGQLSECNPAFREMLGYTKKELCGMHFTDITHPDDVAKGVKLVREMIAGKRKCFKMEKRYIRKDGQIIWGNLTASLVRDADGNPQYGIGMVEDITERKKAEDALKESEEKYQAQFEDSLDGIVIADAKTGIIIDCNPAIQKLVGREKSELIGRHQLILHPPEEKDGEFSRTFKQHLIKHRGQSLDSQIITKDGQIRDVSIKADLLNVRDKSYLWGIFHDITERQRAEREIKEIKESYERLTDNADEAIFRVKADGGEIVYVNPAAERIFGYSIKEWQSDPALADKMIHPDYKERQKQIVKEIHTNKEIIRDIVLGWITRDGRKVIMEYTIIPIIDQDGKIIYFESIGKDITQRQREKERLEKYKLLFSRTNDLAYICDSKGNILYLNEAFEKLSGHKIEEFTGKSFAPLFDAENLKIAADNYSKTLKGENPQFEITFKDTGIICEYKNHPLRDEKDNIIGVFGIARDITERKRAEEKLKTALNESQKREREIAALLEGAKAVQESRVFEKTARSIYEICKKTIGSTSGYIALSSSDEINNEVLFLDSGGSTCTVDESLPMPIRGLRAMAYNTQKTVYDNNFSDSKWMKFMPEGHSSLENVMFAPLLTEGKAVGLLGLANKPGGFSENDVQIVSAFGEIVAVALQNSRTFELLENSEERFRSVVQTATDAIINIDNSGNVTFWNKKAKKLFGYSANEIRGKPLTLIIPKRFHKAHIKGIKCIALGKKPKVTGKTVELAGLKKGGTEFPLELSLASWKVKGETFFTGIIRDITERKQAEEELAKYHQHLEDLVAKRTAKIKSTIEDLKTEITERKRAEEEINKFKFMSDRSNDAYFLSGRDAKFTYVNKAACRMLGYSESELLMLGVPGVDVVYDLAKYQELFDLAQTKAVPSFETINKRKDGTFFPSEITVTGYQIDGKPYMLAALRDTTERKQAEEALRDSEALLEEAQGLTHIGSWSWDVETDTVRWSKELYNINGYDPQLPPPAYAKMSSCYTKESWKKLNQAVGRACQKGEPYDLELDMVCPDGQIRSTHTRGKAVKNKSGRVICLYGTVQDITDRKKAEEQLRKLSHAIEQSPTTIMITDAAGNIEYVNPKFTELTGYSADEVLGKKPDFLNSRRQPVEFYNQLWETIQCGETWHGEFLNKKKNGELYWEEASISPVLDKEGSITHYVAVKVDITKRKRIEEELTQHREHLQDLVEERTTELKQTHKQLLHAEKLSAIGKMSASIAHEFNNPIFGIRNVLEGIKNRVTLKKIDKEEVNLAISECDRIKNLIFSLQNFHKPTSGLVAYLDLHKALDDMLLLCNKQFKVKNIKVRKQYVAHMPKIRAVEDQIKQVILNLLTNAQEAIPQEGGTIHVKTKVSANTVSLQIKDSGVGIRAKDKDKIFEPFFSTKPAVKGAGLGLSVSYGIIKTHGGDIEFESQTGKGTTFTVTLPLMQVI